MIIQVIQGGSSDQPQENGLKRTKDIKCTFDFLELDFQLNLSAVLLFIIIIVLVH
jgi:hypothetical protein